MKHEIDLAAFETPDIGLASALVASGYDLVAIGSNGFKFWQDEGGFDDVVSSYRDGNYKVRAQEHYRIIRLLDHLRKVSAIYDF